MRIVLVEDDYTQAQLISRELREEIPGSNVIAIDTEKASGDTSKPASRGHLKTGQLKARPGQFCFTSPGTSLARVSI